MQSFFAYLAGKAIFRRRARANRRGILDAMNREHGYTLMETLVTLTLMMILSVGGLYGWQRWQQQQRLWQTAVRCGIFCSFCAMTPTPTTGTACFASADEVGWCLSAEGRGLTAPRGHPSRCARAGRGSRWLALRPVWGFMVCAAPRAGNLRLQSAAGSWSIVISHWGRIRLCRSDSAGGCQ
ncbi:prepilin peptidase-dependent protein A [Klebsiella pneumoniae]|uniref:Prepilin peptidase-dependent protein A n=1 Tax=Klebsiella pneumoniae TaxID=573 RepID=A0A919HZB8_KLEPN|nr:prepilin peptidase-dependent protein A [Klebsiella pneumoniae]